MNTTQTAQTVNANLNSTECLKSAIDFGVTHIHNICTGTVSEVPWGSAGWILCIFVLAGITLIMGFFLGLMIAIIRDR